MLLTSAAMLGGKNRSVDGGLKDKTAKLGAPTIRDRRRLVAKVPQLCIGSTKMNNNLTIVDEVAEEGGPGTVATLFVKAGVREASAAVAKNISALRLACCS